MLMMRVFDCISSFTMTTEGDFIFRQLLSFGGKLMFHYHNHMPEGPLVPM